MPEPWFSYGIWVHRGATGQPPLAIASVLRDAALQPIRDAQLGLYSQRTNPFEQLTAPSFKNTKREFSELEEEEKD
jgi:hypothetical protein